MTAQKLFATLKFLDDLDRQLGLEPKVNSLHEALDRVVESYANASPAKPDGRAARICSGLPKDCKKDRAIADCAP